VCVCWFADFSKTKIRERNLMEKLNIYLQNKFDAQVRRSFISMIFHWYMFRYVCAILGQFIDQI